MIEITVTEKNILVKYFNISIWSLLKLLNIWYYAPEIIYLKSFDSKIK